MGDDHDSPEVIGAVCILAVADVSVVSIDEVSGDTPILLGINSAQRGCPLVLPSVRDVSVVVDEVGREVEVIRILVSDTSLIGLGLTPASYDLIFNLSAINTEQKVPWASLCFQFTPGRAEVSKDLVRDCRTFDGENTFG